MNAIIIDGGIESQTTKQSSIGHGHKAPLTENWAGFNWKATKYVTFGVAAEGVTGNALKFTVPNSGNTLKAYVRTSGINLDNITAGYYKLTAYVKTNNTKSYMYVGTSNSATFTADGQWNKVTLENVQLTDSGANLTAVVDDDGNVNGNGYELGFNIVPDTTATGDTYVLIDDICLERTGDLTPPAPVVNNMLSNASFEDATPKAAGYTDYLAPSGQHQDLANGWYDYSWNKAKKISHITTNPYSGTYALKFAYNGDETRICPGVDNITGLNVNEETYTLPAGTYKLSAWVRGNGSVKLVMPNKTSDAITPTSADTWQQVTQTVTYDTDVTLTLKTSRDGKGPKFTNQIGVTITKGSADTYIVLDDVLLEKVQ